MANNVRISVRVDDDTAAGLAQVRAAIASLRAEASRDIRARIDVDSGSIAAAAARLAALRAAAGDTRININDGGSSGMLTGRLMMLAKVLMSVGPAAAVAAGGLAALAAQAGAAGAGIAVFGAAAIPVFSQIKSALGLQKAAQTASTAATTAAVGPNYALISARRALAQAYVMSARQQVDSQRAIADAERALSKARREGASAVADARQAAVRAHRDVGDAEYRLFDLHKTAAVAQRDLTKAREDATKRLRDLDDAVTQSSLDQEDATARLASARENLNRVMGSITSSGAEKAEAQAALKQAEHDVKTRTKIAQDMRKEAAKTAKDGVAGDERVQAAAERLTDAKHSVAQAARDVKDAQAREAEAVKAIGTAQQQAAERIREAQDRVSRAHVDAARAAQDSARSIADAQLGIQQAMQSTAAAAGGGASAMDKYKAALAAMSPIVRQLFFKFEDLKTAFKAWSKELEPDVVPVFIKAIDILIKLLPMLTPLVRGVARELANLMDKFSKKMDTKGFQDGVKKFSAFSIKSLKDVIGWFGKLKDKIGEIKNSEGFQKFMDLVAEEGPNIARALGDIAQSIGRFVVAAAPISTLGLKVFGELAEWLNKIPLPVLNALVLAIASIGLSFKVYKIAAAVKAWAVAQYALNGALLLSPMTWLIVGIGLLVAAIVLIATKTTWFQTAWKYTWNAVKTAVRVSWEFMRDKVFAPIGRFFTETIPRWARNVRDKVVDAWNGLKNGIKSAARNAVDWVKDKFNGFVDWIRRLPGRIGRAASGAFNGIKNAFRSALNWIIDKWNGFSLKLSSPKIPSWVPVIGGKSVGVNITTPNIPRFANGGISGGGMAMVGERGREIVNLPAGSRVRNNNSTERMMGAGGNGNLTLYFEKSGNPVDDVLIDLLKERIRVRYGGKVDRALATG